jgi:hypothetical protein
MQTVRIQATTYNAAWVTIAESDSFAIEAASEFGLTLIDKGQFLKAGEIAHSYVTDYKTAKRFAQHVE